MILFVGGIMSDIDYQALFHQLRRENESLRLLLFKIQNDSPSLFSSFIQRIQTFVTDEENVTFLMIIVSLVFLLFLQTISTILIGRFTRER